MSVSYTVNKSQVYNEVAKTTSYAGLKMADDASAYERVFTTDADRQMLERFWGEACNHVTELMKPFLSSVSNIGVSHGVNLAENYTVTIEPSASYDNNLTTSISTSLFSFFVEYIVSQWYKFTNKAEAEGILKNAMIFLEDVKGKIWYKKKPTRKLINN